MLYLADHCISYLYKLPVTQAEVDMERILSAEDFDMAKAIEVFDRFFARAEVEIIGGMKSEWMDRFDRIGRAHTLLQQARNPIWCNWVMPKEWFVEGHDLPVR